MARHSEPSATERSDSLELLYDVIADGKLWTSGVTRQYAIEYATRVANTHGIRVIIAPTDENAIGQEEFWPGGSTLDK